MKNAILFALLICSFGLFAQEKMTLESYQLENGFKVYLLPDKNATTTFGAVAVNAGSKNDPADATGLAHYLEHLLFKGTTKMGTKDFQKEKPFLDSITIYYQQLKETKDEKQRKAIKALINKQAVEASKYGLPTEFHGLLTSIGGTSINAFTTNDMTVYHNSFPGEQMEKWLDLYVERFQNPVFRSFQSELEVVYEEKNRGSDNFGMQLIERIFGQLYPTHPYGTQTTIGTSEHLKNPPINRIYEFFKTYYVANNMALVLSGNFDVENAKALIKAKFGSMRTGVVPPFPAYTPYQFTENKVDNIRITPIKLGIIGWKSIPESHQDEVTLKVCNYLLTNESQTGFLDKLQLDGKLLGTYMIPMHLHDDGGELLVVVPKLIGQSFKKAEKLVFTEINRVINGDFSDEFLERVKRTIISERKLEFEDPEKRGIAIVTLFNTGKNWDYITTFNDSVNNLTKEDIVKVAKKYYDAKHYTIHSKTGFPKKDKLEKPNFKPVIANQNQSSEFAQQFNKMEDKRVSTKYLDFKNDVEVKDLGQNNVLYLVKNPYNNVATLNIKYYVGKNTLPNISYSADILNESSPQGMSLEEYKKRLSEQNATVNYAASDDFFDIKITCDEQNVGKTLNLVQQLLTNPVASKSAHKNMVDGYKSNIKQEKKTPAEMGKVLKDFALYGSDSEYKSRLSIAEVKKLEDQTLLSLLKEVQKYSASFHYCGNQTADIMAVDIAKNFTLGNMGKASLTEKDMKLATKNTIYVVNDSKARQNQVYFLVQNEPYQMKDNAMISLYNQYMGGAFSGLILQEIREYRSLAYTAGGRIAKPMAQNKPLLFNCFVGCQADKTNEAIDVMLGLIQNMPKYPERLNTFKRYVSSTASTAYPTARNRSERIENLQLQGFSKDPKEEEVKMASDANFDDFYRFYEKNIQKKPIVITIYGNTQKINMDALKKLGEVIELKVSDIAKY